MYEPPPFAPITPQATSPRGIWGVRDMALCTAVVLAAVFIITTVVAGPFIAIYGENAEEALISASVANLIWNVSMIAAVFWFVRRRGATGRDLGLVAPDGTPGNTWGRAIGLIAATFFALYALVVAYGLVIDTFGFDFLEPDEQVPSDFFDSDLALAVLGIAVVFGAPIAEEIFFRGFLFGGTRRLVAVPIAAVLTGALFSLAHYNIGLIIPFTGIGAGLALAYQYGRTLIIPIGAHFLFNLVSYSVLVFVPDARPDSGAVAQAVAHLLGG